MAGAWHRLFFEYFSFLPVSYSAFAPYSFIHAFIVWEMDSGLVSGPVLTDLS